MSQRTAFLAAYRLWVAAAVLVCFSGVAAAETQTTIAGMSADFIMGAILTVGLAGVGAYSRRVADEQRQTRTDFVEAMKDLRTDFMTRVATIEDDHDKRMALAEHEQRQLQSQISLLRELVFREYPNKVDTERHRDKIERALDTIHDRLNALGAPPARRSGDHEAGSR